VPLVLGPIAADMERTIAAAAADAGAPVVATVRETTLEPTAAGLAFRGLGVAWDGLELALPGAFQRDNARCARRARDRARHPAGRRGGGPHRASRRPTGRAASPRSRAIPGRYDGADNPDGVAALVRELPGVTAGGRRRSFAVMADKDWPAMLDALCVRGARGRDPRRRRGLDPALVAGAVGDRVPVQVVSRRARRSPMRVGRPAPATSSWWPAPLLRGRDVAAAATGCSSRPGKGGIELVHKRAHDGRPRPSMGLRHGPGCGDARRRGRAWADRRRRPRCGCSRCPGVRRSS
jgi:hypothetical protein